MAEDSKEMKVSLKLLIDSEGQRLLFAEASKDFVDFLFYLMTLPIGTVVKLLKVKEMAGCLTDLYQSIESLNGGYLLENINKDEVLSPRPTVNVPLLSITDAPTEKTFYRCIYTRNSYCYEKITDEPNMICQHCNSDMSFKMTYVVPEGSQNREASCSGGGGYVRGLLTYMVMDNLEVKPMSTISAITLLNKFHVKDVSSLIEKEVQVGLKEGVEILKASLETQAVLTSVFLGKKQGGFEV